MNQSVMDRVRAASIIRGGGEWYDLLEATGVLATDAQSHVEDLVLALRYGGVVAEQAALALHRRLTVPLPEDRSQISTNPGVWFRLIDQREMATTASHPTRNSCDQATIVRAMLDSLCPTERLIVALRYYERLQFEEIAKVLETDVARIRSIHEGLIVRLRELLGMDFKPLAQLLSDAAA